MTSEEGRQWALTLSLGPMLLHTGVTGWEANVQGLRSEAVTSTGQILEDVEISLGALGSVAAESSSGAMGIPPQGL